MAAKKGQSEKAGKVNTTQADDNDIIDDLGDDAQPTAAELAEETAAVVASAAPEVASATEEDNVRVAMFVDVDPAPTIGHPAHGGYSFLQHGIKVLKARESYTVPKNVADILIDKKLAGRVG